MNPLAIALQGVGFTPALVAVQGFANIQEARRAYIDIPKPTRLARKVENDEALLLFIL